MKENLVFLAPMAGVTDRAFREIAMEFGADRCFTEMVSSKGLYYNDKKTADLLRHSEKERPIAVQIFGHEPEVMGSIVEKALAYGGDFLDINSGCPAKKIISNGDGGAMMRDPQLFGQVVKAVVKASPVPVSVKIRKGWDDDSVNAVELAKIAQESGAALLTIHGRTVKQGYSGTADWDSIRQVVEAVEIPVIGNGDIFTPQDAKRMLEQTGCQGVMLGRGILGNPFLIRDTVAYLKSGELLPQPAPAEKIAMAKRHVQLLIQYKGEYIGIREARKHAAWYIKGMPGSARIKGQITGVKTYDELCGLLDSLK